MQKILKKVAPYYLIAVTLFVLVVSLLNAKNDSATFDEVAHIPAGYTYLTEHDWRLNPEHPPLIKALSAFPLLFLNLDFDTSGDYWTGDLERLWDEGQWASGRHLLYEAENDWDAILFWSRAPIVLLSVALGLFLFYWGYRWIGLFGGLAAFTLYGFDPNILGHNHYVTTDIGIAAFITFSVYFFLRFIRKPTWTNVFLGGLFLGLAHLAKFSSVLLLPLFGCILIAYPLFRLTKNPGIWNRLALVGRSIGKGVVAFLFSLLIVWIGYAGLFYATPAHVVERAIDFHFPTHDERVFIARANTTLQNLNARAITRPFSQYLTGVAMVFKRVSDGNGTYFMGKVSDDAFPLYFPIVFLIKETPSFLLLLFLAALFALIRAGKRFAQETRTHTVLVALRGSLRSNLTLYTLLGFVLLYAYLSVTGNLNIGFRHLFPLLPFTHLLVAYAAVRMVQILKKPWNIALGIIILPLLLWHAIGAISAYPYYVSYFNPIAGGPKNGYHFVTDSNADWGQDLERLKDWIEEYEMKQCNTACQEVFKRTGKYVSIDKIRVDYFGGGDAKKILGGNRVELWWDSRRPIESGWYAISTNFSQGSIYDIRKPNEESYRWLLHHNPVDQVGTSIFMYYIP